MDWSEKKNSDQVFCEELNLCWDNSEFTVLGVKFTKHLREITEINYLPKIEEMKKLFLNWSKRFLTPTGKITVIKSLALSKINHFILSLPKPSEKIVKDIYYNLNLDDNFNLQTSLSLPFNIEQDTNLKWFQFRIIHRILITNFLPNK